MKLGVKRRRYRLYILLAGILLLAFHIPLSWVETWRSLYVSIWQIFPREKEQQDGDVLYVAEKRAAEESQEKVQLRNYCLSLLRQNRKLRSELLEKIHVEKQLESLKHIQDLSTQNKEDRAFFIRRVEEKKKKLESELKAVTAHVIYRDPSPWNTSLWIDIGEKENRAFTFPLIRKNSPVLYRSYLIGWIEYVGERNSRVRLVTDSSAVVSVRAVRGDRQDREFITLLSLARSHLCFRDPLFDSDSEKKNFLYHLEELEKIFATKKKEYYLAKGELTGACFSKGRSFTTVVKGVGFNYDYADEEGEAVDVRRGKSIKEKSKDIIIPLLQEGDLLVTTGLDGMFPADLPVAIISHVYPLEPSAAWYDITAQLCAGNVNAIDTVSILPSLNVKQVEYD